MIAELFMMFTGAEKHRGFIGLRMTATALSAWRSVAS
jgi:hypothetical protein